ncbi:MAG TPA: hypothetical protein VEV41_02270 [Terriglobales bacterium]|nr:hypothetical protein [Terriglobales bacterium]
MERMLLQQPVESKPASNLSTLKGVLEQLGMTSLAPEFVAAYKREKLEQITHSLRPDSAREITEEEFSGWERTELRRMCKNDQVDDRPRFRFRDRLHKRSLLGLPGDAPVVRFWDTPWGPRYYTCLRWVRVPLEEAHNVPEFVKAKASEIANLLPEATFTVEQLRSEKKIYDPFLIVSYANESYYVEVWEEPEFERKYT